MENIRRISGEGDRVSLSRVEKEGRGERGRREKIYEEARRGRRKGGIGRIINNELIVTRVAIPVDDGTSILLARTRSERL